MLYEDEKPEASVMARALCESQGTGRAAIEVLSVEEAEGAPPQGAPFTVFLGEEARPRMLALCSEPGMGRRDVITATLSRASNEGARVLRRDFRGVSSEATAAQLVRMARNVSRMGAGVVVGLDELPASDESCVRREARALHRMWESGASIVFSLSPEARQLLEALPGCVVVGAYDLLVRAIASASRSDPLYEIRMLTRGIPSLVRGLRVIDTSGTAELVVPSSYYDALSRLVSSSLRITLTEEDLRVRLAMLLLGHGTARDLERVLGSADGELLASLRGDAPLFGVSERLDSFACLRSDTTTILTSCFPILSSSCALFSDVGVACAELLIHRGDYERAAILIGIVPDQSVLDLVIARGSGFIEAGEIALVSDAVEKRASLDDERSRALSRAVANLGSRLKPLSPAQGDAAFCAPIVDEEGRAIALFSEARQVLRGGLTTCSSFGEANGALGRRLIQHREACELMVRGHFSAALDLLAAHQCPKSQKGVSAALLSCDLAMTRLLLLDGPVSTEETLAQVRETFHAAGLLGLEGYPDCLEVMSSLLSANGEGAAEADALAVRAERGGDILVRVLALVAGSVFDVRRGAYSRAHVRATLAQVIARSSHLDYLGRIAGLFDLVARFSLGERDSSERVEKTRNDDLGVVCALVGEVIDSGGDATSACEIGTSDVPRDALWLLLVLTEGMGDLSDLLREQIPPSWARALLRAGSVRRGPSCAEAGSSPVLVPAHPVPGAEGRAAPLEIRLLGGFEMRVRGSQVPDWRLDRRNAKSMIAFLALQRGGTARRHRIVEQVWPESDYTSGFNKVYQATSAVRAAVSELDEGLDPFVMSRSSKAVTLNMSLVSCDIDEFRACAREASDGEGDAHVVAMARRAERLYEGDLYVPLVDATGVLAAARLELRSLYIDGMVAGADAALRLGQKRTSARLATNAFLADDMREDALIALVQALRASGRNAEADQHYRSYAHRLAQASSRPPSRMLRQAVGEEGLALPSAQGGGRSVL